MHKLAILTVLGLSLITARAGTIPAPQSGVTDGTVTLTQAQQSNLLADRLDTNVHSTVGPAGELGGQLTAVPESQHVTLMALLGFLLLGAVQSFRKQS